MTMIIIRYNNLVSDRKSNTHSPSTVPQGSPKLTCTQILESKVQKLTGIATRRTDNDCEQRAGIYSPHLQMGRESQVTVLEGSKAGGNGRSGNGNKRA